MSKSTQEKQLALIRHWQRNPLAWIEVMFPEVELSTQQKNAFTELGKLIDAKLTYAEGKEMTGEQKKYYKKIGLVIPSGNGTGKDFFTALCNMFFIDVFAYPKMSCTANTAKQLRNVLWSEIAKIMRLSRKASPEAKNTILEDRYVWQSELIYHKEKGSKAWFIEAVTVNTKQSGEEQAEAIAGRHEDFMLWSIDEASGISDAVFHKIERTLTGLLNLMIIIFNPTRSKGYAIEAINDPRFISMRWNAEESELVSKEHIEGIASKYGRDSNPYRIGVLGLPPLVDQNTLIPMDWIMDSINREIEIRPEDPVVVGIDVGAGGDKSVCLTRKGAVVTNISRNQNPDTVELTKWATREIMEHDADGAFVDIIGVGNGLYYNLADLHRIVWPVDVRRKSNDPERFHRVRDELWWKVRDRFEKGTISIPNDKELIDQLSAVRYDAESGKIKIESKKKMKDRSLHSPDEADALCLTFEMDDDFYNKGRRDEEDEEDLVSHGSGWMAA